MELQEIGNISMIDTIIDGVLSPDGEKIVITYESNKTKIWNVFTHQLIHVFKDNFSKPIFSRDGKLLFLKNFYNFIILFDNTTYQIIKEIDILMGLTGYIRDYTILNDNETVICTIVDFDNDMTYIKLFNNNHIKTLLKSSRKNMEDFGDINISYDNKYIIFKKSIDLKIFNLFEKKIIHCVSSINYFAVHPNKNTIIYNHNNILDTYDFENNKVILSKDFKHKIDNIVFSNDGSNFITMTLSNNCLELYDTFTCSVIFKKYFVSLQNIYKISISYFNNIISMGYGNKDLNDNKIIFFDGFARERGLYTKPSNRNIY